MILLFSNNFIISLQNECKNCFFLLVRNIIKGIYGEGMLSRMNKQKEYWNGVANEKEFTTPFHTPSRSPFY